MRASTPPLWWSAQGACASGAPAWSGARLSLARSAAGWPGVSGRSGPSCPAGCGRVALSKACLPSLSGKVWLTTGRSLPSSISPASRASSAGVGRDDEEHGVDAELRRLLLRRRGAERHQPPARRGDARRRRRGRRRRPCR